MDLYDTKKYLRKPLFDKIHEFQKENNLTNAETAFILTDALAFWTYNTARVVKSYEEREGDR